MPGPLDLLEALARQEVVVSPTFRHLEVFTMRGLLTVLWHGDPDAEAAVVLGGGAMGGLLGPADGFYHWLGEELAPAGAASGCSGSAGAGRTTSTSARSTCSPSPTWPPGPVPSGSSPAGTASAAPSPSVRPWRWATGAAASSRFATQSAGCEEAGGLTAPLLAYHGDRDEILPLVSSQVVGSLVGGPSEVIVCEGAGHLLSEAGIGSEPRCRSGSGAPGRPAYGLT